MVPGAANGAVILTRPIVGGAVQGSVLFKF